jgi:hypothetical protein
MLRERDDALFMTTRTLWESWAGVREIANNAKAKIRSIDRNIEPFKTAKLKDIP